MLGQGKKLSFLSLPPGRPRQLLLSGLDLLLSVDALTSLPSCESCPLTASPWSLRTAVLLNLLPDAPEQHLQSSQLLLLEHVPGRQQHVHPFLDLLPQGGGDGHLLLLGPLEQVNQCRFGHALLHVEGQALAQGLGLS